MCSICDLRIEFSVDHPSSLGVAVETRRAIDAGLLPEPRDSIDDGRMRLKAIDTLKAAQQRLEQTLRPEALLELPDFFVLLVESRTWAFFRPTPTGFDPKCQPAPPNVASDDAVARDAVLVASELAMGEIVEGRLPFETALRDRVVTLDADATRHSALLSAWSSAYPEMGFSRFVCA
jgi:hypothetical protein